MIVIGKTLEARYAVKCEECGNYLLLEEEDLKTFDRGIGYVTCPACGHKQLVGYHEFIEINAI